MLYFRCPTCKNDLANKQIPYEDEMRKISNSEISEEQKEIEKMKVLDKLHITKYCCRMRMLTYIQLIDIIRYTI